MKIKKLLEIFCLPLIFAALFSSCDHDGELTSYEDPNPANAGTPVLNLVNPANGVAGDTIVISGNGFNTNPAYNFVSFGTECGTVISSTNNELKVVLPNIQNKTVQVKVSVKGSVYWSNAADFVFRNVVEIIDEGIADPTGVAVDEYGNVYVGSIADRTIYKITTDGQKSVFVSDVDVDGAIHFGPNNYLYACMQNSNKIVKISADGSVVEDFLAAPGNPIDFDWDKNGNLYVVMNWDGIYKADSDGNLTSVASVSDALTCRVFEDFLYVCNSWSGNVIKFSITSSGELEEATRYSAGETTMGIEIDQNGTVYYDRYWKTSLYSIDSDGNEKVLFENQLVSPMRYLCYQGKTIYAVQNEGVDSGGGNTGQVIKMYVGVKQAPNYGRN
jgi:sugar lactone lactonase YvrE